MKRYIVTEEQLRLLCDLSNLGERQFQSNPVPTWATYFASDIREDEHSTLCRVGKYKEIK